MSVHSTEWWEWWELLRDLHTSIRSIRKTTIFLFNLRREYESPWEYWAKKNGINFRM